MRLFSYIFLFLLTTWQLIAQTYPVQVVPVLTSPYSSKIADYANPMANRLQLQVITTDLSVQNRPVQLYVEIKGNGLSAASAPVLSGVSPLRINGGEILRLTNAELASYFQFRNLQGITSQQYDSALPDGMYSFCFRVKDVLSGRWLSQSHCAIAYLMLNDPPILNIPTDNEQVAVTDFQNIIFSWTPRQINATNVTYSFELREILDPTLDPRFAFEVSRLILKEDDLRMTTFVYDVSKPNLISGRRYAWRVRAISTGGLAENSVFKNNGYSEVHSFVYAVNCSKPLFLLSQQQGKNRTKLLWQGHTLHQKYHIQYRKKGVANAQWFEASTRNTQTLITDLEAGEYEFRVGATCETERYGIKPSYVYSDIQTFEIEKTQNTTESAYNCGIVPKIAVTTKKPLGSLVANEVFVAGDFSVTILEVSGNNGIFSGKGFIKVPYLNDTKLAVEFENIKINADYQLTDGVVKTTYDSDWKGVQFLENTMAQGKKSKDIKVSFEVEKVETRNDEIVVIGKDGRKEVFPFGGNDSSVKGKVTTTANGVTTTQEKIYHIDKEGKVSSPQAVAQGGKPTKENTNGVTENGEATALTAKGIEVRFENTADSKYAYEVPTKAYSKDYQKMGGKYLPFKAVVKGEAEPFLAKVHISDKNISPDSLIFKTDKGALIESKRIEGSDDFLLTLKGFYSFAVEQVQATIKQGKKYQIAGVFNLVHLSPKTAKVVLVPTAENLSIDTDRVKAIYNKIGVTLDITWAAPFDITPYLSNGVLETKDVFGDLTDYSLSQQKIINAYKSTGKVANDTYYVFITNAKSNTGQGGYMALGGQFGFVFDQTARTLAHELGHGIFKLAHPFKKKQQGNVPSLMDYTSDEDLLFADWKQINDPAFKVGIFQGQSEGEYKGKWLVSKILQQIRCYYLSEKNYNPISDSDLKYFDDLLPNDSFESRVYQVSLRGRSSYKVSVKFLISKNRKWNFPKEIIGGTATPPGMGAFTQYDFGKLQILTTHTSAGTDNYSFADYLSGKPLSQVASSQQSSVLDSSKDDIVYLEEVSVTGGYLEDGKIDDTEFEQLKNSAICGLAHFTPQERIGLIKALIKRSSREAEEDLILDILHNIPEGQEQEFLTKLSTEDKLLADLAYSLDDSSIFGGREDNRKRLINEILRIWGRTPFKEEAKQDIVVKKGKFDAHILKIEKGKIHFDLQYATPKVGLTTDKTLSAAAFEALDYIVVDKDNSKLENKRIPAFVAYILLNQRNSDAFFNYLSGYIDTYSFGIGLNSLKGIQKVPQAYRKLKTVIGGVEVGSATADIFLTYGESCENEEVCQKLRQLIFAINVITLSADIYTSREIQQLAQETLESANRNRITLPNNIAEEVTRIAGKSISKLVEKLNLGKFIKKIGDYEVYENGEVFYRAMTKTDLETLKSTGKLTASSETFTSPTLTYIKNTGYNGTIVKFQMKTGTIEKLKKIGTVKKSDSGRELMKDFGDLLINKKGWIQESTLFKIEGTKLGTSQVNIGLGKGKGVEIFNENIINFQIVK